MPPSSKQMSRSSTRTTDQQTSWLAWLVAPFIGGLIASGVVFQAMPSYAATQSLNGSVCEGVFGVPMAPMTITGCSCDTNTLEITVSYSNGATSTVPAASTCNPAALLGQTFDQRVGMLNRGMHISFIEEALWDFEVWQGSTPLGSFAFNTDDLEDLVNDVTPHQTGRFNNRTNPAAFDNQPPAPPSSAQEEQNSTLWNTGSGLSADPFAEGMANFLDGLTPEQREEFLRDFSDQVSSSEEGEVSQTTDRFVSSTSYSSAVFNAIGTLLGSSPDESSRPSEHANRFVSSDEASQLPLAGASVPGNTWHFFGSGRVSVSRDESGSQDNDGLMSSVSFGGARQISRRVGLSFQLYGGHSSIEVDGTDEESDTRNFGALITIPVAMDNGWLVTPIVAYQHGWTDMEETVAGSRETSNFSTGYVTLGTQVQRRWLLPDGNNQSLYYVEPQARLLHTWSRRDTYTRSDGTRFASDSASTGRAQLALQAGAVLPVNWGFFEVAEPVLRLDASHLYGDDDGDWQAGVAAGLRLARRNSISASLSLSYSFTEDRQALSGHASLTVPLQP